MKKPFNKQEIRTIIRQTGEFDPNWTKEDWQRITLAHAADLDLATSSRLAEDHPDLYRGHIGDYLKVISIGVLDVPDVKDVFGTLKRYGQPWLKNRTSKILKTM